MSQAFILENGAWVPHLLKGEAFPLRGADARETGVSLRCAGAAGWFLLSPASAAARVNGQPVLLGIRALRDRDEIKQPGAPPVYFSTELLVQPKPYTGEPGGTCLRCASVIAPGSPAVRCGNCRRWYHQSAERGCFEYGQLPICVECGVDSVVSDEFRWVPEEEL